MDKIIKSSKIIYKILVVIFWVIAVCGIVAVAACAIALVMGDEAFLGGEMSLKLGECELTLAQSMFLSHARQIFVMTLANVVVIGAAACYVIRVLCSVFRPMSEGQPFVGTVSVALKKLAFAVLFSGIASTVLYAVTNIIIYNTLDVPSLFAADKVTCCTLSLDVNLTFLVWFAIFLLLGNVFRYGEQLQQQADETL